MPQYHWIGRALSQAAIALLAASLVASCETTSGSAPPPARSRAVATDVGIERVVLQAYRAIGDRHLFQPDFRTISAETFRGFAGADPALSLQTDERSFTVLRDGHEILSRPTPANATDGRAWGGMLGELFAASVNASPLLQQGERQSIIKGAMTATARQLDRNSRYADPEEARDNRFQRDGGGGIGITVERTDDKKTMIRAVQEESPAAKAGIKVGDQIVAVDSESMIDRSLSDVVHKLRGNVGDPVSLTVQRAGEGRLTIDLNRGRIIPTTVLYERRDDIGLIRLMGFNSATTENMRRAVERARTEIGRDIAGIVIDMRSNRGGLLDQAQAVAEQFIGDGTIFSTHGRHPDSQRTYRSSSRQTVGLPMVALVNGNSASAAEIVAAALQDRGRAVIVGTTSYGKGTVQTVVRLPNEGELVLTWSRLQAPSGYTWNELGVLPNICTSKVADVSQLGIESVEANRSTLMRWHAERNPSAQEVAELRRICPPSEESPQRDLDIAFRLLKDPKLYAHAVRTGSIDQAARQ
ncbi:MAG: PDZ domain-containing protein [Enhydrobacter sp.]|nr:MAG: PDZ domain-containing protein [Enhydrobacter sp.]